MFVSEYYKLTAGYEGVILSNGPVEATPNKM
jgi:hypothetical protein